MMPRCFIDIADAHAADGAPRRHDTDTAPILIRLLLFIDAAAAH